METACVFPSPLVGDECMDARGRATQGAVAEGRVRGISPQYHRTGIINTQTDNTRTQTLANSKPGNTTTANTAQPEKTTSANKPLNGKPAPRVISDPNQVAQLVMFHIDAVSTKKDEMTIAIKNLADVTRQRARTRKMPRPFKRCNNASRLWNSSRNE